MKKYAPTIIIAAMIVGFFGFNYHKPQNCVNVYVDYGILDNQSKTIACIPASGKVKALDVINSAKIELQGTVKYGSQIVCRVNNLPSSDRPIGIKDHKSYIETCQDMPAEFAYWAVLIKRHKTVTNPLDFTDGWQWAETGIADITLEPSDSIGLVFSDNENTKFPQ